eukprot:gene10879-biopygen13886
MSEPHPHPRARERTRACANVVEGSSLLPGRGTTTGSRRAAGGVSSALGPPQGTPPLAALDTRPGPTFDGPNCWAEETPPAARRLPVVVPRPGRREEPSTTLAHARVRSRARGCGWGSDILSSTGAGRS